MTEELIKYETAVLAKEKGFNIETDYLFLNNKSKRGGFNNGEGWENRTLNWNSPHFERVRNGTDIQYSQPTQSLLQRWLREVHRIYIYIIPSYTTNEQYIIEIQYGTKLRTSTTGLTEKSYYSIWEEALEEGLKQALLLI